MAAETTSVPLLLQHNRINTAAAHGACGCHACLSHRLQQGVERYSLMVVELQACRDAANCLLLLLLLKAGRQDKGEEEAAACSRSASFICIYGIASVDSTAAEHRLRECVCETLCVTHTFCCKTATAPQGNTRRIEPITTYKSHSQPSTSPVEACTHYGNANRLSSSSKLLIRLENARLERCPAGDGQPPAGCLLQC